MPTKPKRKPLADEVPDRPPPHSIEAEQGILGSVLLSPTCIAECKSRVPVVALYDLRHQVLYRAMLDLHQHGQPIELITLQNALKRTGQIEDIGGLSYLTSLPDVVPSAANLSYYIDIVREKHRWRKVLSTCDEIKSRIYTGSDVEEVLYATRSDMAEILDSRDEAAEELWTVEDLANFDFTHDPNAVIGYRNGVTTRFLCKGYSAWLIGQSGIGKSSILTQWAIKLAIGMPFCGIESAAPRRVGIIQAENDKGDTAEFTQGILRSLSIGEFESEDQYELVKSNLVILTERRTVGEQFCDFLRRMIIKHRLEVVFADPFLSFAAIDVTRLSECSRFLRQQVNPVLHSTGAVLICAHHSGKPKFDKGMRAPTALDYAYAGIGSSELVNWARAVMVLLPVGGSGHDFELKICKRGTRAGATDLEGEQTTSIFLRHATDRVFWEQVAAPVEPEEEDEHKAKEPRRTKVEQIVAANTHEVISLIPEDGETASSLGQRFHEWSIEVGIGCGLTKCRTDVLYALGNKQVGKLQFDGKLWFKGKNA